MVATDDGYLMLYSASGGDHPRDARILLARSEDGITWEKVGRVIEPQDCDGADARLDQQSTALRALTAATSH